LHPEPDQGRVTRKRCAFDSTTPNYLIDLTLLSVSDPRQRVCSFVPGTRGRGRAITLENLQVLGHPSGSWGERSEPRGCERSEHVHTPTPPEAIQRAGGRRASASLRPRHPRPDPRTTPKFPGLAAPQGLDPPARLAVVCRVSRPVDATQTRNPGPATAREPNDRRPSARRCSGRER
jgi:hypothetical protein